jgi:hypothetical protein
MNLKSFINERKYEILLVALVQHLYIGIFVTDLAFYTEVIWPINMVILGLASVGVFIEKGRTKNSIKNALTFFVELLPILLPFFRGNIGFMLLLNICYVIFYSFIFLEVFKFLIKPSYINTDIISAAACGLFLLIEIFVFLFQMWVYRYPQSFKGVDYSDPALTFMDLVYFCSVTLTTIGYGDITPNVYFTKLTTSLIGVAGQFYSVVLVGILISKFTSNQSK